MQPLETGNREYPYYIGPMIEEYRKLQSDSPEAIKLRQLIAVNISDPTTLCLILGVDSTRIDTLYPGMGESTRSTMETIDTFLAKYGGKTDTIPGAYIPEAQCEENSVPTQIKREKTQGDGINSMQRSVNEINKRLTALIKEKRYSEALQIIEHQNLINPEKNIYFADQIRFLKKLIKLNNKKTNPRADKISRAKD